MPKDCLKCIFFKTDDTTLITFIKYFFFIIIIHEEGVIKHADKTDTAKGGGVGQMLTLYEKGVGGVREMLTMVRGGSAIYKDTPYWSIIMSCIFI